MSKPDAIVEEMKRLEAALFPEELDPSKRAEEEWILQAAIYIPHSLKLLEEKDKENANESIEALETNLANVRLEFEAEKYNHRKDNEFYQTEINKIRTFAEKTDPSFVWGKNTVDWIIAECERLKADRPVCEKHEERYDLHKSTCIVCLGDGNKWLKAPVEELEQKLVPSLPHNHNEQIDAFGSCRICEAEGK